MNENEPNLSNVSSWLENLRKNESEQSARASAIIETHLKSAGLDFKSSGETKTWSSLSWDLYININRHLSDEKYAETLKAMFVELVDFCEISTSESFAYKLKVLLEKFIDRDPPRSKIIPLLPEKALAQFGEIDRMMDDDHERYMEILNQQGY